ncbi:hypothetical protein AGMMS49525_16520 [Bacteroidia bacterium]|nr:hypothetical protein AGMMS49525_16520 [Bacteroidia bacterium]
MNNLQLRITKMKHPCLNYSRQGDDYPHPVRDDSSVKTATERDKPASRRDATDLPTEAEWEYAAKGGQATSGFTFSGSNTIDDVAWITSNSGGKTHDIGTKLPNELDIYDMSGNVYE